MTGGATISLSSEPIVAALQIVAVVASPHPQRSQRTVNILLAWQRAQARLAGLPAQHPGMSPRRIEDRLAAPFNNLHRRFEAARWALMMITRNAPIQVRFHGADQIGVRALARWADPRSDDGAHKIRDTWTASKPVLAMAMAMRAQFDDTPTMEALCFNSEWVKGAVEAEPLIAGFLDVSAEIEYSADARIRFIVPDLASA